jgi:N-acetyl-gamma-glutamyl-phosphate reductase
MGETMTGNENRRAIAVGVVGASGYSGAELVRLLLQHPGVDLRSITSRRHAGETLAGVFPRLAGLDGAAELCFSHPDVAAMASAGVEVAFLALPHGLASEFALPLLDAGMTVIDLSADFRLDDPAVYRDFYGEEHPAPELLAEAVYGCPEIHAQLLPGSRLIAAPGCYPTSILLPLVPLLREGLLDPESICVFSMSGVSGAGKKESIPFLFAECNESLRAYSVPRHRHLSEIEQELSRAAGRQVVISFTPHLVPVTAGIATTISARPAEVAAAERVAEVLQAAYAESVFVRLRGADCPPDTKDVVGTNFIDISWSHDPRTGRIILMSAEDNLLKGAAGQAVQAFNVAFGLPETQGLLTV